MVVVLTENVPEGLRGELTRWLLEVKTGTFIGNISAAVREQIWSEVKSQVSAGAALLIYSAQNEQGFSIEMHNTPKRRVIDVEGISLMSITCD